MLTARLFSCTFTCMRRPLRILCKEAVQESSLDGHIGGGEVPDVTYELLVAAGLASAASLDTSWVGDPVRATLSQYGKAEKVL